MTIKECIDIVDNIKPNQYGTKEKVQWLSFIDAIIINDVLKTHEGYDGRYDEFTGYSEDKVSVALVVPSPYDRLYTAYLKMKIDGENGETARYNNSAAEFNSYLMEYRKYYNKTHMPLDTTRRNRNGNVSNQTSSGMSYSEFEKLKNELYSLLSKDKINEIIADNVNDNVDAFKNKVLSDIQTLGGTVVSPNADFAEVAEWADGNPNVEDRTGYFVCTDISMHGIVMRKAKSADDVKGVTILAPAFASNYSKDKVNKDGNLLPKYSYVAIIGFVPVRDNGTCTVGGRCMPDNNGCAIPSSNNMGYQVISRLDKDRVLIIIEPNGDMVQRVKAKTNQLQKDVDNLVTLAQQDAGKISANGGEIFNDYENNNAYGKTAAAFGSGSVAGSKGFNIQSYDADARTVTLDSLVGLEVGFVCSMGAREKHFDLFGKITGINGNVVTFDSFPNFAEFPDFDYEKDIPTMLWIPDHPELGTTIIDSASFVGGDGCKSTGENSVSFNTDNKSIGKHSATFGKGNIAAFAALAINFMNKALGRSSLATGVLNETTPEAEGAFVGGNSSKAKHPFTFVFGKFLSTAAKFQTIFGFFNKPNEGALFQVGNGIHDNEAKHWEPRTAFEVLENGSARVQTQGETADSVAQVQFVESKRREAVTEANVFTNSATASLSKDISAVNASMNAQTKVLFNAVNLTSADTPLVQKLNKHATMLAEISANISDTFATIADITLTEEVNTVVCAVENSFADIGKITDFYITIEIPKHETQQTNCGMRIYLNNSIPFAVFNNYDTGYSYNVNWAGYSLFIPNYNRFNMYLTGFSANALSTSTTVRTTSSKINEPLENIIVRITDDGVLPIGTNIKIVGWVQ